VAAKLLRAYDAVSDAGTFNAADKGRRRPGVTDRLLETPSKLPKPLPLPVALPKPPLGARKTGWPTP